MDGLDADAFQPPPVNMLSEQIDLPEHCVSLGLLHMDGTGIRVCTWDGKHLRHMSAAAAKRLANELGLSGHVAELAPVSAALRGLVSRVEAIEADVAERRKSLATMPVEGSA